MDTKIEYRVIAVSRYVVTRYHASLDGSGAGVETKGEFESYTNAFDVAYALCKDEHQRLGHPIGSEFVVYPKNARHGEVAKEDIGQPPKLYTASLTPSPLT